MKNPGPKWYCHVLCDVEVSGYHARGCISLMTEKETAYPALKFADKDKVVIPKYFNRTGRLHETVTGSITANSDGTVSILIAGEEHRLYRVQWSQGYGRHKQTITAWLYENELVKKTAHTTCPTCTCEIEEKPPFEIDDDYDNDEKEK